jgi:hypothetical protein
MITIAGARSFAPLATPARALHCSSSDAPGNSRRARHSPVRVAASNELYLRPNKILAIQFHVPAVTTGTARRPYSFCIKNLTFLKEMTPMASLRASAKAWLLALSLTALGCSGSDDGTPSQQESKDPTCEAPGIVDPTLLIDDFEDGDGLVAVVGTRNGSWWLSTDGTAGTVNHAADASPPAERIFGGRCGSDYGVRVTGSGFSSWGAVLSAGFRYAEQAESIDASAFRGLSFYARVGSDNDSVIRMQLQDASTYPEGGNCNTESGSPDECYNGFGTELVGLDTTWQKYTFDFATLTQREGWGFRADAVDPATLFALDFNLDPDRTFDLWIDDVWFYEK